MTRVGVVPAETLGASQGVFVDHVRWGSEVDVTGPISVRTSAELRSALFDAIDAGSGELVLRLAGAEVWDATGLGVLVGAHHRALQRGRTIVIVGASQRLTRLVRRTRLERVMDVRTSDSSQSLAAIA